MDTVSDISTVLPAGLLTPTIVLKRPLKVSVWEEGDEYVAAAEGIAVHAFGADADAAVAELRTEIAAYFTWLENAGERITPRLKREREDVRALVSTVDA